MSKRIPLTQGKFAIVDDEDYEWLSKYKWYAMKDKNTFYAIRHNGKWPNRHTVFMHRQILNVPPGSETDHKNHNGLDNRRGNIRTCTHAQNHQNEQPVRGGTSQYKGVDWNKNARKWRARIKHNYKTIHLGYFDSEVEAAEVYDKKAKELFGEYAAVNFHNWYNKMKQDQEKGLADYT